jgi:PAS domain S-box-containing protein
MASEPGGDFRVTITVSPANATSADSPAAAHSGVPVLVVNDNASQRLALKVVLAPLGYSIVEADSGLEALRCVMAQDFAVILLDVCMPVMDGFETAALIRQRRQSEMTPLIFITAYGSDEIVHTDLYAEGAVDFIFAPVPPEELRAKVSAFGNLFIQAEELAIRAREVQASADEFWLLTDAAPIGIFQTDAQNRYVYTNPRWSEITGIAPGDAAGQRWDMIISAEAQADIIDQIPTDDSECAELGHRFEIRSAGAAPRIVFVTSKSIPGNDGGTSGWVGTLADVTAEAGAEIAMSEARDKATEASRLKSDFLANMSHEIRTPMNGVLGMTDLLLETNLDARQRDYAQTVRNSGEALLTIINDILDFSRVEAGKLEIEDIEFDPRSVLNDVVALLAGPAQTKGLELIAVIDRSAPAVVSGDPGRVRQVLTNLIGNAIKFTQAGEIVVRAAETTAGPDAVLRFEVSDTGDGIRRDKLAAIFQPFVQSDSSTSRRYGGTGLGLAISSQLVSLMGGDCGVTSQLGAGSTFWFTLPARADAAPIDDDLSLPDADLVGVSALIVDDSATQREVLSEALTAWGMVVATADSGVAALDRMRTALAAGQPFGVTLLDGSMPGMDAAVLKEAVVADPCLSPGLVLMIRLGEERHVTTGAGLTGATLSKPIHLEELRTCLRVALRLEEAGETSEETAPPSRERTSGRLLLAEDNLINQKVAVAMLSNAGYRVDVVHNGVEAVNATARRNYDAILMDCQMPEMNGYEATAAIRTREGSERHTPIIAMTAGARHEDREHCLAEGMDSYLSKPVGKDALLNLVARSVQHSATIDQDVFDELRVLGDDGPNEFLRDLVDRFVDDTEPLLVQARDALDAGDAVAIAGIAHSIKAGCSQLGGLRLAHSCSRLEAMASSGDLSHGEDDLQEVEIDYQELRTALALVLTSDDQALVRSQRG